MQEKPTDIGWRSNDARLLRIQVSPRIKYLDDRIPPVCKISSPSTLARNPGLGEGYNRLGLIGTPAESKRRGESIYRGLLSTEIQISQDWIKSCLEIQLVQFLSLFHIRTPGWMGYNSLVREISCAVILSIRPMLLTHGLHFQRIENGLMNEKGE